MKKGRGKLFSFHMDCVRNTEYGGPTGLEKETSHTWGEGQAVNLSNPRSLNQGALASKKPPVDTMWMMRSQTVSLMPRLDGTQRPLSARVSFQQGGMWMAAPGEWAVIGKTQTESGLTESQPKGYGVAHAVQAPSGNVLLRGDLTVSAAHRMLSPGSCGPWCKPHSSVPSIVPTHGQPVSKFVSEATGQVNVTMMP